MTRLLAVLLFGISLLAACQHSPKPRQCTVPRATVDQPSAAPPEWGKPDDTESQTPVELRKKIILLAVKSRLEKMLEAIKEGSPKDIMAAAKEAIYSLQRAQEFGLKNDDRNMADMALRDILKIQLCIVENLNVPLCRPQTQASPTPTKPPDTPDEKQLLFGK